MSHSVSQGGSYQRMDGCGRFRAFPAQELPQITPHTAPLYTIHNAQVLSPTTCSYFSDRAEHAHEVPL